MNEYKKLTTEERKELEDKIAKGCISRSCRWARRDWFNVALKSGRRCIGAYAWGAEEGDFERLKIENAVPEQRDEGAYAPGDCSPGRIGPNCPSCGRDNREYGNICTSDDCPATSSG